MKTQPFFCLQFKSIVKFLILLMSFFLIACSPEDSDETSSSSDNGSSTTIKEGVFFDSAVGGVSYVSGGQSGETSLYFEYPPWRS